MNYSEIKRIKKTLDILEEGFKKRALTIAERQLKALSPRLEGIFSSGEFDPEGFKMPLRNDFYRLFGRYIQECYIQGMHLAGMEIDGMRKRYSAWIDRDPVVPEGAVKWMDNWIDHFGGLYEEDKAKDVAEVIRRSLQEGYNVTEVKSALRQYLTDPEKYNGKRLETIARTNATTAFNQGRLESFRQDPDFVVAVEFMAVLDERVSDICESRDGKVMKMDDPTLPANTPPLHYNCRSILSPIDIYEWEEMQEPGWRHPRGWDLKETTDWSKVTRPQEGFGNVGEVVGKSKKTEKTVTDKAGIGGYPVRKREELTPEKEKIVRQLEKDGKLYIEPVTQKLPAAYRQSIKNDEEFKKLLYRQFGDFPESLLEFIKESGGKIYITTAVKAGKYENKTAFINPRAIIRERGVFQEEIVHFIDHFMGGHPDEFEKTLSSGYGINEKIARLGKEIKALYERGDKYYFYGYMGKNGREYLAQGVRQFLQDDPKIIEELDPLLYNMMNDKFLNEDFWRNSL